MIGYRLCISPSDMERLDGGARPLAAQLYELRMVIDDIASGAPREEDLRVLLLTPPVIAILRNPFAKRPKDAAARYYSSRI